MKNFFYRVTSLDTTLSVSEKFSVPIGKLVKDNNLNSEISEGDMLYVQSCDCRFYKVKPTDTLKSLSEKFNVPEQKILDDNCVPYIFYGLTIII